MLSSRLLDEWDEIAQASALPAHDHEVSAEDGSDVGLAAVGTDLAGLGCQLLRQVRVPGDQRAQDTPNGVLPFKGRLVELVGERPGDLETAVHLVDVPSARGDKGNQRRRTATHRRLDQTS